MSVTIAKKMFKNGTLRGLADNLRAWIVSQIPELTFFKSVTSGNYPWWLYKFEGTDYGIGFDWYDNYNYLRIGLYHEVTDATVGDHGGYPISGTQSIENGGTIYTAGAIVIRTAHGIIIQGMTSAGVPFESFLYVGKTESGIRGQITVDGNFSAISYVYSRADNANYQEHTSGSSFSFKIKNESPVTWRVGALTAIRPHGAGYGTAGSIVASAVYGVTSTTWMDPVRIDAFYALNGPVLPPYHQEVTLGGRTMIRIASSIAVEK